MPVETVITEKRNGPMIATVAELWINDADFVVDTTFGLGNWWTSYRPTNFVAHDLDPAKGDGVDFRRLPEATGSVDVVAFDPPYISIGGRDTSTVHDLLSRYGLSSAPKSTSELDEMIADGIQEAARVLKPRTGRLLLKSMNYVKSGKHHPGHLIALNNCLSNGYFIILDEFVHYSGTGPQPKLNPDGTPRRQVHARAAHSFLTVLGRTKVEVA